MTMHQKPMNYRFFSYAALILLVALSLGHFFTSANGWYSSIRLADLVLHIIGGLFLGLVFLALSHWSRLKNFIGPPHPFFIFLSIILFSTFGSFVWEVYEFVVWNFFPQYMNYSTALGDALLDIAAGTVGGLSAGGIYLFFQN